MTRTLRLALPEDVYRSLARAAEQSGQAPEALAVERLVAATHEVDEDPVEKFIGAFESPRRDWVDRHDEYLGQAAVDELQQGTAGKS